MVYNVAKSEPSNLCPLTFPAVCKKALEKSPVLQAARSRLKTDRASYIGNYGDLFPQVGVTFGSEYTNDLSTQGNDLQAFGSDLFKDGDGYSSSLYAISSYSLTSIPTAYLNTKISRSELRISEIDTVMKVREILLDLLGLYADALIKYHRLSLNKKILGDVQQLEEIYTRLAATGKTSEMEVVNQAIETAKAKGNLETTEWDLRRALARISLKTGEVYELGLCTLAPFDNTTIHDTIPITESPELLQINAQIDKKRAEKAKAYLSFLPQVNMNVRYALFKDDSLHWTTTLSGLGPHSMRIGGNLSWNFSSVFQTSTETSRLRAELNELQFLKEQLLMDLQTKQQDLILEIKSIQLKVMVDSVVMDKYRINDKLAQRLREAQVIGEVEKIKKRIEAAGQEMVLVEETARKDYLILQNRLFY